MIVSYVFLVSETMVFCNVAIILFNSLKRLTKGWIKMIYIDNNVVLDTVEFRRLSVIFVDVAVKTP